MNMLSGLTLGFALSGYPRPELGLSKHFSTDDTNTSEPTFSFTIADSPQPPKQNGAPQFHFAGTPIFPIRRKGSPQNSPTKTPPAYKPETPAKKLVFKRFIAAGGMGKVYEAEITDEESKITRLCAAKVVNNANSGDAINRLRDEWRLLESTSDPRIVKPLGFQKTSDGYILLMEFVDGLTLRELLKFDNDIPLPTKLQIIAKVADILFQLSEKRIIHRDISLNNIMLDQSGVRLIDLGIAKGENVQQDHEKTQIGFVPGTIRGLSYESVIKGEYSHQSDLYGLGIVLLEMLIGPQHDFFNFGQLPLSIKLQQLEQQEVLRQKLSEALDYPKPILSGNLKEDFLDIFTFLLSSHPERRGNGRDLALKLIQISNTISAVLLNTDLDSYIMTHLARLKGARDVLPKPPVYGSLPKPITLNSSAITQFTDNPEAPVHTQNPQSPRPIGLMVTAALGLLGGLFFAGTTAAAFGAGSEIFNPTLSSLFADAAADSPAAARYTDPRSSPSAQKSPKNTETSDTPNSTSPAASLHQTTTPSSEPSPENFSTSTPSQGKTPPTTSSTSSTSSTLRSQKTSPTTSANTTATSLLCPEGCEIIVKLSDKNTTKLTAKINGSTIITAKKGNANWSLASVPLQEGQNSIFISYTDESGQTQERTVTVEGKKGNTIYQIKID